MALRSAAHPNPVRGRPRIDLVRRAAKKLGGLRRGTGVPPRRSPLGAIRKSSSR
jgi:hypothetical protein